MTKKLKFTFLSILFAASAFASDGGIISNSNKTEIRYIKNGKRMPDVAYQQELRNKTSWKNFKAVNGTWYVIFNEENAKPHRAFGKPVQVFGMDAKAQALNFITQKLNDFTIPVAELNYVATSSSEKYKYVHFSQTHDGAKVLNSDLYVKLTTDGKVITFGADVFSDINISVSPAINSSSAILFAKTGITESVTNTSVNPLVCILPIPEFKQNTYKLVYEVTIETIDSKAIPSKYYTLVDAQTGEVLYRQNKVKHDSDHKALPAPAPAASTDVTITGTVYPTNPYNASATVPLRNLKLVEGATTYNTDSLGFIGLTNSAPTTVDFTLEGLWSKVITGSTTPSFTATVNPGTNALSFNSNANIRELSAYYHVNIVHDYMKTKFPAFTGMDNPLPTNVDLTSGTCNAFYDGASINFYALGGGCNSMAQVGDVIYHEYGHGINDKFYQSQGGSFDNGAMGEGYADIWALGITANPVLGIGMDDVDPTVYVRRYDMNPKIYPQDLVGEVHADGEIIAGAWWDTGVNFGDLQKMMDLYKETFYAVVTGPDGTEGQVYVDILIEALTSDDVPANGGDNDITNGTPNGLAIVNAFAAHGITLLSNAVVTHTPVVSSLSNTTIPINAAVTVTYPWAMSGVKMFYKINRTGSWISNTMTNTGGTNYTSSIPSQPQGTVIGYYIGVEGTSGILSAVQPFSANLSDPNIPYFILNGTTLMSTEDFDDNFGAWGYGIPSDNATTGIWVVEQPLGSFSTVGDPSTLVQPNSQHTVGGQYCAVTGNAASASDALGTNDVDGGETTLESPVYDLSTYTNPIFSYYRWYINNPPSGANPGNDTWEVQISNNGSNWIKVERTHVSDKSWRRFAFRVKDYVTLSNAVQIRFVAEDSLIPGANLNGGSIVEAAIDDMQLYEETTSGINENDEVSGMTTYPNPAKDNLYIDFSILQATDVILELTNSLGQKVYSEIVGKTSPGVHRQKINIENLAQGIYVLNMKTTKNYKTQKITIVK